MPHKERQEALGLLKGKVSKDKVNYRPGTEGGTKATCMECEYYVYPGQEKSICKKVTGVVEAEAVCDLFEPRKAEYGGPGQKVQPSVNIEVNLK